MGITAPGSSAPYGPENKAMFDVRPYVDAVSEFTPDINHPRTNQQMLLPSSVKPRHIEDGSITNQQIANETITTSNIAAGGVTTPNLNLSGSGSQFLAVSQTTTSAAYIDLATPGPNVEVTINPSGLALVIFGCQLVNNTTGEVCTMSFNASGANTIPVGTYTYVAGASLSVVTVDATKVLLLTGLQPGSTLFSCKYKVTAGTGTFSNRVLSVIPL